MRFAGLVTLLVRLTHFILACLTIEDGIAGFSNEGKSLQVQPYGYLPILRVSARLNGPAPVIEASNLPLHLLTRPLGPCPAVPKRCSALGLSDGVATDRPSNYPTGLRKNYIALRAPDQFWCPEYGSI